MVRISVCAVLSLSIEAQHLTHTLCTRACIGFATTSSVAFADELLPRGFEASGQGFLSTIKCFGQFTGLLIGGYLDGRVLYRVLAAIVGVGSLLLAIAPKCTSEKLIKLSRSGLSLNNLLDGTPA